MVALRWLMFIIPIIVVFFYNNGLDQTEVMLLQSLFSVAIVVFEIPSGYFSDVMGRKTTIVLGCITGTIGLAIYSISYGFWGFLAAELLLGLGASFISGTDSAILYDTLIELGREHEYPKIEGRRTSVCNFSETAASILGGVLATISLRTPFYVETAVTALTIPIALTLVEPERHRWDKSQGSWRSILRIVRFALREQLEIKWLIFYSAAVGSSTLTMVWFIQPYLLESGLPLAYFGVLWAALNFSVGVFSLSAYRIERFLGRRVTLLMLIPISFTGYIITGAVQSLWAIPALFLFYFVRGVHGPVLKDYVNRLTSSDRRATVLSVKNMISRLLFTLVGPVVGYIKDIYTIRHALFVAGTIFLLSGAVAVVFLRKNRGV